MIPSKRVAMFEYVSDFLGCFFPLAIIGVVIFYADKVVRKKPKEIRGFEVMPVDHAESAAKRSDDHG